jgi:hypothetical protein
MPNRENRGYNGIDVLEKGFSGQHNRQEVRQLRPSEHSSQKNIPEREFHGGAGSLLRTSLCVNFSTRSHWVIYLVFTFFTKSRVKREINEIYSLNRHRHRHRNRHNYHPNLKLLFPR